MLALNIIYFTLVVSFVIKNEEEKVKYVKNCTKQTIKKIFNEDDTLLFMFVNTYRHIFPDYVGNPSMIIDMKKDSNILNKSIGHKQNFVIYSENYYSLLLMLNKLSITELWLKNKTPLRKVLLIIPIYESYTLTKLFQVWWKLKILNVVILTYDLNSKDGLVMLKMSDPLAIPNQCETEANLIITHTCNDIKLIKFPNVLRKHENCFLTFIYLDVRQFSKKYLVKSVSLKFYIIDTIAKYLNMTLKTRNSSNNSSSNEDRFKIGTSAFELCVIFNSCSRIYNVDDSIWVVPAPERIPPMESLKLVFKRTVWILILVTFILTSLILWLLERCKYANNQHNMAYYFLKVSSMTILGLTNDRRLLRSFRFLIISYVIYSIHIQAVFTGKLFVLLTIPQFEQQIRTLTELSETNNSIIIRSEYLHYYNFTNYADVYRKIQKKFIAYNANEYINLLQTEESAINYTIHMARDVLRQITTNSTRKYYYFQDNSYFGSLKSAFCTQSLSYFTITVNEIITRLIESGLINHHNTQFDYFSENRTFARYVKLKKEICESVKFKVVPSNF
ncbi:hypothetical protein RN001_006105 [Aquatica leii]|uniref:Ionotropic glutamate receptor C-terminal domain-containing protein n=1 Tax=Aquatica leii TaxID=1421715 RepID=A0AAN7PKR9_9COLE|nr:hypothetical protein RN001_006105 [Aquatica leii]